MIPATVKTPPMMAHKPLAKCPNDFSFSVYLTITGANSYEKNTPGIPDSPDIRLTTVRSARTIEKQKKYLLSNNEFYVKHLYFS